MPKTLPCPDAAVTVADHESGKKLITVRMHDPRIYIPHAGCLTSYSEALIEKLLEIKGPAWLCDEILRDESPDYVQKNLHAGILEYVPAEKINGRSILDFGCGSGASTMILSRMFPDSEITGIELDADLLSAARARAAFYGREKQIRFYLSPGPDRLPEEPPLFDFIVFSAVFEHLLPDERRTLLPLLWSRLNPGGVLFLNETPYRCFPVETHTTAGLPLINYLPDRAAGFLARRCSRKNLRHDSWETLLRKGIRGGSKKEIRTLLVRAGFSPVFLSPCSETIKDSIDLWYRHTGRGKLFPLKTMYYFAVKLLKLASGISMLPYLSLALQKPDGR